MAPAFRLLAGRVLSQGQGPLPAQRVTRVLSRLRCRSLAAPSPVVRDRFAVASPGPRGTRGSRATRFAVPPASSPSADASLTRPQAVALALRVLSVLLSLCRRHLSELCRRSRVSQAGLATAAGAAAPLPCLFRASRCLGLRLVRRRGGSRSRGPRSRPLRHRCSG